MVFCDLSIHEDDPGFERVYGEPGNLRNFAAFDVSISRSFYDDYRYVNFTSALVNTDGRFDLRDGIYAAPYSGTYLFAVHGLPMRKRPFRLQGGREFNFNLFATYLLNRTATTCSTELCKSSVIHLYDVPSTNPKTHYLACIAARQNLAG